MIQAQVNHPKINMTISVKVIWNKNNALVKRIYKTLK